MDKSKYEGTPSASFFQFLALWMVWSALIGLVTTVILGTTLARLASADGLQPDSLLLVGGETHLRRSCYIPTQSLATRYPSPKKRDERSNAGQVGVRWVGSVVFCWHCSSHCRSYVMQNKTCLSQSVCWGWH